MKFLAAFAFVLGAAIGSFLNVCIYRMPRNLSVNQPRRSFCPSCNYQIPWWNNLPLISWLALRGKCGNCGAPIAFRYLGVELLTGFLFLAVWLHAVSEVWLLAFPYWVLISLFVVATFIDFEHFIIPDEITWGGAAAGIVLSFVFPQLHSWEMHGGDSRVLALGWGLAGAALGYALLWLVVELGKKAFGKKSHALTEPAPFTWVRRSVQTAEGQESDADLTVGDVSWKKLPPPAWLERMAESWRQMLRALKLSRSKPPERGEMWTWSETFYRETDRLLITAAGVELDGESLGDCTLAFTYQELAIGERKWKLDKIDSIRGVASQVVIPREAMGFGDVKFIACIGAFLGWPAVLFTIMAASVAGSVIGIGAILVGRREWSAKIPFGPYLALGATLWMFAGPELVDWYIGLTAGQP